MELARKVSEQTWLEAAMVAYLYAGPQRLKQAMIAERLNWSPVKVNRLFKLARDQLQLLAEERRVRLTAATEERIGEIEQAIRRCSFPELPRLTEQLKRRAGRPLRAIHVISTPPGAGSPDKELWDEAAVAFGEGAALPVASLLHSAHVVGVAWGRTLRAIVRGLAKLGWKAPWKSSPIKFFPMWGEVHGDVQGEEVSRHFPDERELSSTDLAMDLSDLANGRIVGVPSLLASPAIIPPVSHVECIRQFLQQNKHSQEIFGPKGLVHQMDACLLAVGSFDQPGRAWANAVMDYAGVKHNELRQLAFGDLGGALLRRPSLSGKQVERFDELASRWMGVKLPHLDRLAEKAARADPGKRAGVIVCGVGRTRAEVVREVVRLGLATELIIDDDLARSLTALLEKDD